MSNQACYRVCDWSGHWKLIDDDYLVYQEETGNLYILNQLAFETLQIIFHAPLTFGELVCKLSSQFDVPPMDELTPAILNTLSELESADLVESES